jgi:hypothetical protein
MAQHEYFCHTCKKSFSKTLSAGTRTRLNPSSTFPSRHSYRSRSCASFIFLRFYDIHRDSRYPADNRRVSGVSHGLGMPF